MVQAAARRQFLLLFDLMFSTPTGLMRAREAAIRFVSESFAPSRSRRRRRRSGRRASSVLVGFTTDRAQLGARHLRPGDRWRRSACAIR